MTAFEITSVEALAEEQGTVALALGGITVGGRKGGVAATVETTAAGKLLTLGVTKLEGEVAWTVDSLFVGGFPAYANGTGARYLRTKQVKDAAIVAALDEAAAGVVA